MLCSASVHGFRHHFTYLVMEVDHARGQLPDDRLLVGVGELQALNMQHLVQALVHDLHHHRQVGGDDAGPVVPWDIM